MNIIGANQEEQNIKEKKLMRNIIIAIITLFVVSIILAITIYYLTSQLFKLNVDGQRKSMPANDLFVYDGDTIYVSLKDVAELIGYKYNQGGYKEYNEDPDKCYLESSNEICTFEEDEDTIYKTPVNTIDYEYFTIDVPIKRINDKLYITSTGLELACNLTFNRNIDTNTITINTVTYYANYYTKNNKYSAVSKKFNNQKAILYGLLVTQSIDNTDRNQSGTIYYGISNLNGEEKVGKKYIDIDFIESTQEFIVKTIENKVGIITSDGDTKVAPQYDSMKQIDKDLNLYLVVSNNKQGVIERNGKTLIYPEYDKIGIDSTLYQGNNIKNPYLLFNNAIPVQQNGKWGLYDKKGNKILELEYDGIGCTANSNSTNNIVIIPSIKTIIMAKEYETTDRRRTTYYGFVNYLGREIVGTGLQRVYSTVNNGRREYFMDYNGTTYNVIENIRKIEPKLDELNDESKANKTTEEIRNS